MFNEPSWQWSVFLLLLTQGLQRSFGETCHSIKYEQACSINLVTCCAQNSDQADVEMFTWWRNPGIRPQPVKHKGSNVKINQCNRFHEESLNIRFSLSAESNGNHELKVSPPPPYRHPHLQDGLHDGSCAFVRGLPTLPRLHHVLPVQNLVGCLRAKKSYKLMARVLPII